MSGIEKFNNWLNEETDGEKRGDRIAWLVKCNGGFQVCGWGCIFYSGCWQQGLEQNDAMELLHWAGFFDGIASFSTFSAFAEFEPYFDNYVSRVESEKDVGLQV